MSQVSGASNFSSEESEEFFEYDPVQLRMDLLRQRIEKEGGNAVANEQI